MNSDVFVTKLSHWLLCASYGARRGHGGEKKARDVAVMLLSVFQSDGQTLSSERKPFTCKPSWLCGFDLPEMNTGVLNDSIKSFMALPGLRSFTLGPLDFFSVEHFLLLRSTDKKLSRSFIYTLAQFHFHTVSLLVHTDIHKRLVNACSRLCSPVSQ